MKQKSREEMISMMKEFVLGEILKNLREIRKDNILHIQQFATSVIQRLDSFKKNNKYTNVNHMVLDRIYKTSQQLSMYVNYDGDPTFEKINEYLENIRNMIEAELKQKVA